MTQFATFLVSVLVTWTSAKTKDRSIHIICLMLVAAVGNAIATATTHVGARFFAMFLMPMGAVSACKRLPSLFFSSFFFPFRHPAPAVLLEKRVPCAFPTALLHVQEKERN